MSALPAHVALEAVNDAVALLTHDVAALAPECPLAALHPRLRSLQRALSRLEVLAVMHPMLTVGDALPAGSVPEDELDTALAHARELDRLVRLPAAPQRVTLTARLLPDRAPAVAHDLARTLEGMVLTVRSTEGAPDRPADHALVDIGEALSRAVEHALPDARDDDWIDEPDPDDETGPFIPRPLSPAHEELLRRFGPRAPQLGPPRSAN